MSIVSFFDIMWSSFKGCFNYLCRMKALDAIRDSGERCIFMPQCLLCNFIPSPHHIISLVISLHDSLNCVFLQWHVFHIMSIISFNFLIFLLHHRNPSAGDKQQSHCFHWTQLQELAAWAAQFSLPNQEQPQRPHWLLAGGLRQCSPWDRGEYNFFLVDG